MIRRESTEEKYDLVYNFNVFSDFWRLQTDGNVC